MKFTADDFPHAKANLSLVRPEDDAKTAAICHALGNETRISILRQIRTRPQTVIELAKNNFMSLSTMVFHVDILADAALINIEYIKGTRGPVRNCYANLEHLDLELNFPTLAEDNVKTVYTMGVGQFSDISDETVDCTFATKDKCYHVAWDNLFCRERFDADLLCLRSGCVTYVFPNDFATRHTCTEVSISLELCSEVYYYDNEWKSDVTFWINDIELLTYTCPGDFGGRRGILNPDWWTDDITQYGELKVITVNQNGVYLNKKLVNENVTLSDLNLNRSNRLYFKLGNKPDANYVGGMNIFGKSFGDHAQDIVLEAVIK